MTPLSFEAPVLRNPTNININLISLKSRLHRLHFCRW